MCRIVYYIKKEKIFFDYLQMVGSNYCSFWNNLDALFVKSGVKNFKNVMKTVFTHDSKLFLLFVKNSIVFPLLILDSKTMMRLNTSHFSTFKLIYSQKLRDLSFRLLHQHFCYYFWEYWTLLN